MHEILINTFGLFPEAEVGIIGSAVLDPVKAKDIDVLFLSKPEFEEACKLLRIKWNGWDAWNGHVRIANLMVDVMQDAEPKKIQLIQISSIDSFDKHPHSVLLRDGTETKPGKYFVKPPGWKYEKFHKDMTGLI